MITHEIRRASDGTHFVIYIMGEHSGERIIVPLSPALSSKLEQMHAAEQMLARTLLLPTKSLKAQG